MIPELRQQPVAGIFDQVEHKLEISSLAVVGVGDLDGLVRAAEVGQQAQLVRMLRRAQPSGAQQVAIVHHQDPVGTLIAAAL